MRKIFIISAIFIVIGVGIVLFLLLNKKSLEPENRKDIDKIKPLVPEKAGEKVTDTSGWERRSTEHFEVSLPPEWDVKKMQVNTGGYTVTLRPKSTGDKEAFPRIDIMVVPYENDNQLEDMAYQTESFGFQRSKTTFFDISAIKLSTILPGKAFAAGNPKEKDVIKDVFIFRKGNNVYQIDYAYYVGQDIDKTKETIRGIFSTLTLD